MRKRTLLSRSQGPPTAPLPCRANYTPTPFATLQRARRIAMQHGIRHVYTGNVRDAEGGATHCHGCGARLIERDGYAITGWGLAGEGECVHCGTRCAGLFDTGPGQWGSRRAAVRLSA